MISAFAVPIVTPWSATPEDGSSPTEAEQDRQRDALYRQLVVDVLAARLSWLPVLLQAANATVVAYPGRFAVVLQEPHGTVDIPQIADELRLVPWVCPDESMH